VSPLGILTHAVFSLLFNPMEHERRESGGGRERHILLEEIKFPGLNFSEQRSLVPLMKVVWREGKAMGSGLPLSRVRSTYCHA
jgi:hypothetical protein